MHNINQCVFFPSKDKHMGDKLTSELNYIGESHPCEKFATEDDESLWNSQ